MLQAVATLVFLALAVLAAGVIGTMLTTNRAAIREALGLATLPAAFPLPPRYRTLSARRATIMTIREAPSLRVVA